MNSLTWIPERYPSSGGLAAAGFYKLLGRPRLDPLTVLVRETAQNSWDARSGSSGVRFGIDGWSPMYDGELDALRDVVFTGSGSRVTALKQVLSRTEINGLFITDRGTLGLGGPTRADAVSSDDVYDWVDFVLNVGKPNTRGHTGGTYGFGKTIAYIVSEANAVVIHSRTAHAGRKQSRLIACAIGEEFKQKSLLHTGRHWWGEDRDGSPHPVTGAAADTIASAIGMPPFEGDDLGTNIFVVEPDFGGRTPEQAMRFIAEAVTWNLWPKLMRHGSRKPMQVAITFDGDEIPVPDPGDRPPLHGFAQSFRALLDDVDEGRRPDGLERRVIRTARPKKDVGDVVTVPLVARPRVPVDDGHDPEDEHSPRPAAAIDGPCHHIALLRSPELVVDYLAGPPPADGGTEWAGVFRSRDDVDSYFAAAEPPTHDSWQPELLEKSAGKTIVHVGLQRIRAFLDARWGVAVAPRPSASAGSTAIVADELAWIVRSAPSIGPGGPGDLSGGGGGSGGRAGGTAGGGGGNGAGQSNRGTRARVEILATGVAMHDGGVVSTARIRVDPAAGSSITKVAVAAGTALDDATSDPDLDPELTLVHADFAGEIVPLSGHSATIQVAGAESTEFTVVVGRSADTAVSLSVEAQ